MGVAASIVVFAIGAILRFATTVRSGSWNILVIGDILMIVGVVAFLASLVAWAYWDGFGWGGTAHRRRRTVIHDGAQPVYGPNGYARTTYGDPGRPVDARGRVIEEEERSVY